MDWLATLLMNVESQNLRKVLGECRLQKKYFELLKQKERAFIIREDWAAEDDSDDEGEYVKSTLMANSTNQEENTARGSEVFTSNLVELTKDGCSVTINEMPTELYHLHVSLNL